MSTVAEPGGTLVQMCKMSDLNLILGGNLIRVFKVRA